MAKEGALSTEKLGKIWGRIVGRQPQALPDTTPTTQPPTVDAKPESGEVPAAPKVETKTPTAIAIEHFLKDVQDGKNVQLNEMFAASNALSKDEDYQKRRDYEQEHGISEFMAAPQVNFMYQEVVRNLWLNKRTSETAQVPETVNGFSARELAGQLAYAFVEAIKAQVTFTNDTYQVVPMREMSREQIERDVTELAKDYKIVYFNGIVRDYNLNIKQINNDEELGELVLQIVDKVMAQHEPAFPDKKIQLAATLSSSGVDQTQRETVIPAHQLLLAEMCRQVFKLEMLMSNSYYESIVKSAVHSHEWKNRTNTQYRRQYFGQA